MEKKADGLCTIGTDGTYELSYAIAHLRVHLYGLRNGDGSENRPCEAFADSSGDLLVPGGFQSYLDALFSLWSDGVVVAVGYLSEMATDEEVIVREKTKGQERRDGSNYKFCKKVSLLIGLGF